MPTVMVERAEARAVRVRLAVLARARGASASASARWRTSARTSTRRCSWRGASSIMPFKKIELGFSRTAQFCGEQLACKLDVFGNLLAGNDNVGIDATPENEPGNQMAGLRHPLELRRSATGPYAIYSQYIGEDESSYLPAKYLAQFGARSVEAARRTADWCRCSPSMRTTTCSANSSRGPYYNCAYNQGRFNVEGYRYHGRVIGHTTDRDAENYALGGQLHHRRTARCGPRRRAARGSIAIDFGDLRNTVTPGSGGLRRRSSSAGAGAFGGRAPRDRTRRRSRSSREGGRATSSRSDSWAGITNSRRERSRRIRCMRVRCSRAGASRAACADPWLAPGDDGHTRTTSSCWPTPASCTDR